MTNPPSARIFRPARTAMQQGTAKTREWVLEFDQASPRSRDPLMGWTSSADTRQQLRLRFPGRDEAIAYAEREGIAYRVEEPQQPLHRRKSYAANFAPTRVR